MTPARLALFGAGRMGRALLSGWAKAGFASPEAPILVIDPDEAARREAEDIGARVAPWPTREAIADADAVVLAVKPQQFSGLAEVLAPMTPMGALVVSIIAGLPLSELEARFPRARAVRAMPNTPALVGAGVTAFVCGPGVTDAQRDRVIRLLGETGAAIETEEAAFDAVTALSGSGPAYVFALAEAMEQAGAAEGLPPALARKLAYATVAGAGTLLQADDADATRLRDGVASPGGTTEAGLSVLLDPEKGLTTLIRRTVAAAAARSKELAD